ncbi:DUF1467 family protein [Parasphingorhabdus halotolerans]|uniref:DUF1467 family protein n=1 Tax=Parasphingorhabdus halotolerans TaxID=2725558 RepID=A0A6H2DJC9_9SPHN|nr:DUF1467 family protein [Parasphingorhabdus halotolerans]QJB68093.1 DUF1467 family protein [Parasphingorhabdus halotolerans]
METVSIIAIYALFWVLSAFIILPFGVKNNKELGVDDIPGQADGAPGNFKPLKVIGMTTLLATVAFGLFYMNYINGWITLDTIDIFNSRERLR